jgi:hypothetical protein
MIWTERLLDLGKCVSKQIRRGAGIEEASRRLLSDPEQCKLALVFFKANDVLKFRAIVEDWTEARLVSELGGSHRVEKRKQEVASGLI